MNKKVDIINSFSEVSSDSTNDLNSFITNTHCNSIDTTYIIPEEPSETSSDLDSLI